MNIKVVSLLILILLFTLFVSQNTEPVPIRFLFWEWQLPKIILITVTGLSGVLAGLLTANLISKKDKKQIQNVNDSEDL